nr:DUF3043 domain-containing protein [Actinomycetales bacterium]
MLFRKKTGAEAPASLTPETEPFAGKGRATPSRKEAQAARHRPLVADDRKAAKETQRRVRNEAYARQQHAMEHGIDQFMPVRDRGPVRRFARDYIDAGFNFGELFMPLALALMAIVLVLGMAGQPELYVYSTMLMYATIFLGLGHAIVASVRMHRLAQKYFPAEDIPKGTTFYGFQRAFQVRRWRMPKPQVRRGEWPQDRLTPLAG